MPNMPGGINLEEMLAQMMAQGNPGPSGGQRFGQEKRVNEMWQVTVYQGADLILEHKQNDYGKVLRFAVTALMELMNGQARDFRIIMCNHQGHVYFSALGIDTQVVDLKKKESIIP